MSRENSSSYGTLFTLSCIVCFRSRLYSVKMSYWCVWLESMLSEWDIWETRPMCHPIQEIIYKLVKKCLVKSNKQMKLKILHGLVLSKGKNCFLNRFWIKVNHLKYRLSQRFDKSKRVYRKNLDIRTINSKGSSNKPKTPVDKTLKLQAKKNKKLQSKGSHVTKLLMFLTVSFFFTTVPYSLFYALKLNIDLDSKTRIQVAGVLALLQYLRHSGNFLIYLLTSSIIKFEIKSIFRNVIKCFISKNKL